MDIGALASSLTTALVPLLPYLLKAGEKAAEETGKIAAGQSWELTKSLWSKLKPKVEAKPTALEAAREAAQTPSDEDVQAALRVQLKKLLTEDQSLAAEVSRWLEQSKVARIVNASGNRSVATGGDVGGSVVSGDKNIVSSSADGDIVARDKFVINQTSSTGFNALHQLPPPPADFTGREDEQRELLAAIEHGGITISGLQGM